MNLVHRIKCTLSHTHTKRTYETNSMALFYRLPTRTNSQNRHRQWKNAHFRNSVNKLPERKSKKKCFSYLSFSTDSFFLSSVCFCRCYLCSFVATFCECICICFHSFRFSFEHKAKFLSTASHLIVFMRYLCSLLHDGDLIPNCNM